MVCGLVVLVAALGAMAAEGKRSQATKEAEWSGAVAQDGHQLQVRLQSAEIEEGKQPVFEVHLPLPLPGYCSR